MANRLARETSPYLLQHAHNPVDWYPWGDEALARARSEDRPIFLSIGYAACHWCHVMERDSFEDEATAAALNADFVPVKVDREERPDLDQVYMAAVVAMTGSGGWPMSLFLTPDGRPFYGGTYFPPSPRHGLPSFRQVLAGVAEAWHDRRDELEASSARLVAALESQSRPRASEAAVGALVEAAVGALEASFDAANGGWGAAPKFPQPMAIGFLLRRASRGDARALAMARRTLDRMADGGIHDQLGGGFHRYATDAVWLVPHFEKMLYDNAQLARAYLEAYRLTGGRRYLEIALDTLDYVDRELTTPDGAWAASQDADTEGIEGATFTWSRAELREAVDESDAALVAAAYGIRPEGNWEGRSILSRVASDTDLAASAAATVEDVARRLEAARATLLARRRQRPQPARDDKVLAAWNGLALAAFAQAAVVLEGEMDAGLRERGAAYLAAATRAGGVLLANLRGPDGRLARSWKDGRRTGQGILEDHADLAAGLLALYGATFDEQWFDAARNLMDVVLEHFADPDGGFFDTADDHERLITRPKDLQDNALPSGNAATATVLLELAALTGESRYADSARGALTLVTGHAGRFPTAFAQWLTAIDMSLEPLVEVAIVGEPAAPETRRLVAAAREGFRPRQVLAVGEPAASRIPLLQGRFALRGRSTAFVCRDFACRQPVTEPEALRALLLES